MALLLMLATPGAAQSPSPASPPIRWPALAASGLLVLGSTLFDRQVAREVHDAQTPARRQLADHFAAFGTVEVIGPTAGVLAIVGIASKNRSLTNLAINTTKSLAVATVAVVAIKVATGRIRPHDDTDLDANDFTPFSGDASFPSGHTTAAFAFATTLGDAIHRPWARVGLYALAGGTAWARVAQEEHWVSDVVAGAALGIASAKFATGRRRIFGIRAPSLGVTPTRIRLSWDGLPWQRDPR